MSATMELQADAKRWAPLYPHLGTGPVSIEPCVSPEYFELERRQIFRRVWLNVGRVEEIPNPGDYFTKDIAAASASIIVVRGDDGMVRAFHNVCSHRGNKIVWDETGQCKRFTCSFHAWSYGLDGGLRSVPDEGQFHDLKKETLGLTPVALDTWEGFIFVNLDPQPQQSLAEFLGEFGKRLAGWPFGRKTSCYSWRIEVKSNWKVAMGAFQESYHVPFVHRRTVPDSAAGPQNRFARPVGIVLYPLHQVLSIYANRHTRLNAVDEVVARHGPGYRKREVTGGPLPGVNPIGSKEWGFDLDTIFPNFIMILWGNGMYITYNFWPLAVDRFLYEVRLYNDKPQKAGEKFAHEYNRVVLRTALGEDLATLEQIQPMLESGAKRHFIFQDNEIGVRHHLKVVDDFVRSAVSS
jgi:Rieske 2Fe-2S family protein